MSKRIGIIGSGISALTCAYHLALNHEVTVFEKENYIGGHTHTVEVEKDGEKASIDTGFIVFNDRTYPHFIELMQAIGVAYQPTEMSFSVRNDDINLEYNGNNLNSLFAQRSNLFRPKFWQMLTDILRFNKDVRQQKDNDSGQTIGSYLAKNDFSPLFRDNYLLPMISAIWSMGLESCLDFPLQFFARFFDNHGLLDISNRPQWYTIKGGSSSYIGPLSRRFKDRIKLGCAVRRISRQDYGVDLVTHKGTFTFDDVVVACHGDQALALLDAPSPMESEVLRNFHCIDNEVILHTDISYLPRRKKAWASWNYHVVDAAKELTNLTYNMNILQQLSKNHTYLVTLNQQINADHILGTFNYSHPVYTPEAIAAQQQWADISGLDRIHYCGAYWFNGFHEDGVKSGLRVCQMLEDTP